MMKYLLVVAFSVTAFCAADAQTFEEKVAAASCECINKEKAVADSTINTCISRSMLKVAMEDSTKKDLKLISTVEGVQTVTKKVRTLLLHEPCNQKFIKPKD
jgi:hypothetical protein